MAVTVVAHPLPGYNGSVKFGTLNLVFYGGFTPPTDVPAGLTARLAAEGFTLDAVPPTPPVDPLPQYLTDAELVTKVGDSGSSIGAALRGAFERHVALTGTAAADTAAIQAAIDDGGRILLSGVGVYDVEPLLIKTGAHLDLGGVTLRLANGSNADLISVPNFATLTGGDTSGGESEWSISNGWLDGNGANQTGTSWTFRVYGCNYRIDNVEMVGGLSGNAYSEWGNSAGGNMEAIWTRFKLRSPVGDTAVNLDWNGPHDSIFDNGEVVAHQDAITLHQTGIINRGTGNGGGEQFTNVHVWGFHERSWVAEHTINAVNCDAEGGRVNVLLLAGRCNFRGRVFGTNGTNPVEYGVQIGDATHTSIKNCNVEVDIFNFAAGSFPFNFASSGGRNRYTGTGLVGTATAPFTGPLNAEDYMAVTFQDGTVDQSKFNLPHPLAIRASSTSAFGVGKVNYDSVNGNWDINGATLIRGYKDSHVTQTLRLDTALGAFFPGTPSAVGSGGLYAGSGAPTFSAVGGATYLRDDGAPGARLYRNTASGVNWVPIDALSSLFLPANLFEIASGTPTLTAAPGSGTWPRWLLDATAVEIVATTLAVPDNWATANVFLWYINEGAGTGVARFQVRAHTDRAAGGSITTSETTHGLIDATMPAQGILARTQVGGALTVAADPIVSPRPLMGLSVRRLAADGADTLANDAALIGVELVRAS